MADSDGAIPVKGSKWYRRGNTFYDRRRYKEAIECYDKAIQINPNLFEAWKKKGDAFCGLEKYDEGINCYDKALKISNIDDPEILKCKLDAIIKLGTFHVKYEYYHEALDCYNKVLKADPNNFEACVGKSNTLYTLKKYKESLAWYHRVLEIDPNNIQVWNRKGNILCFLKKYEESQQCYDKVKELNPNDDDATIWHERGNTFYELKRYDEAIKCYDKIVEVYRKTPYTSRISCNEAIESYDKAIQKNLNNNKIELLYNKGLYLLHSYASRDDCIHYAIEALKCYDKIIEINPNHVKAWIMKGLIHERWGRWDEAIKCYDKAIEINSNYENNSADVWLRLCYTLAYESDRRCGMDGFDERERPEKALDCINKALGRNSKYADNPYIWKSKGEILYFLDRYEEAVICYDKALEIDPNYNSAYFYKGIAFQKLGKDDDTRNRYFYLQHRDSDTTEKYEISKFDGTLLDNIVNQWW
jgi:tetratricopeptide (TPR) repeat protein